MAAYVQELRVYYADTDATGVVFHANYLVFAERARVDALRARDAPASALFAAHGCHFLVRSAAIDYWRPLRLDDRFALSTATAALGGASCVVRHDFAADGVDACRVVVRLACVRAADGRPVRIPARWRTALADLAGPVPDAGGAGRRDGLSGAPYRAEAGES